MKKFLFLSCFHRRRPVSVPTALRYFQYLGQLLLYMAVFLWPRDVASDLHIDVSFSIDKNLLVDRTTCVRYAAVPRWMNGRRMNEIVFFFTGWSRREKTLGLQIEDRVGFSRCSCALHVETAQPTLFAGSLDQNVPIAWKIYHLVTKLTAEDKDGRTKGWFYLMVYNIKISRINACALCACMPLCRPKECRCCPLI